MKTKLYFILEIKIWVALQVKDRRKVLLSKPNKAGPHEIKRGWILPEIKPPWNHQIITWLTMVVMFLVLMVLTLTHLMILIDLLKRRSNHKMNCSREDPQLCWIRRRYRSVIFKGMWKICTQPRPLSMRRMSSRKSDLVYGQTHSAHLCLSDHGWKKRLRWPAKLE